MTEFFGIISDAMGDASVLVEVPDASIGDAIGNASALVEFPEISIVEAMREATSLVRSARGATWLTVELDTVLYRRPSKWHQKGVLRAGALVVPSGPPFFWHGFVMAPLRGGGCVDIHSLQEFVADFQVNPDLVVITLKADRHVPSPLPRVRKVVPRFSLTDPPRRIRRTKRRVARLWLQEKHPTSTEAKVAVPDRCGRGVATPCLVPGGCCEHRRFWEFQLKQSGGRGSFQHKHDPAWQAIYARSDGSDSAESHRDGRHCVASLAERDEVDCDGVGFATKTGSLRGGLVDRHGSEGQFRDVQLSDIDEEEKEVLALEAKVSAAIALDASDHVSDLHKPVAVAIASGPRGQAEVPLLEGVVSAAAMQSVLIQDACFSDDKPDPIFGEGEEEGCEQILCDEPPRCLSVEEADKVLEGASSVSKRQGVARSRKHKLSRKQMRVVALRRKKEIPSPTMRDLILCFRCLSLNRLK